MEKIKNTISTNPEIAIIQKLKSQQPDAMDLIYKLYGKALFGIIVKMVKNTQHAEDTLQEAFVKMWNSASTYDSSKGRLYTWMLTICRNTAMDKVRSKAYKQELQIHEDENYVSELKHSDSPNPDSIGVKEMTEILADDQRELIELVYFKGFSHIDVSKEINMPLGTVKTKIRSALMTLRSRYKE